MKNKDLQRLLSTFPDDLEVYEIGIWTKSPVCDVVLRKGIDGQYLAFEALIRPRPETFSAYEERLERRSPTESDEKPEGNPEEPTIKIRP